MPLRRRNPVGFSLIELLIVIVIMGILAGLVMPSSSPSTYEQLRSAAQVLRNDLAYCRSLAVSNNSVYWIKFDGKENRYTLEHTGIPVGLDALPDSPFRERGNAPDKQIVDLDELPNMGLTVRLAAAGTTGAVTQRVDNVEFGPLGETTRSRPTTIWLAAGQDLETRYITLTVNPVTGLTEVSDCMVSGPPGSLLLEQAP